MAAPFSALPEQRNKHIDIFKVETEAGTHFPGQSKAPHAIIETACLRTNLEDLGYEVHVLDALGEEAAIKSSAKWQPAPKINGVRNEENAVKVMHQVCGQIINQPEIARSFSIVVGGDCSITPAVLSGFWHGHGADKKVGLLYIDGDVDLTLPSQMNADGSTAILDAMAMTRTHLTRREGGLESMRAFGRPDGDAPLIDHENVVFFGFDPLQPGTEHWVYLLEEGFKAFTRPKVENNAVDCMQQALRWLSERVDVIYVHFDVDVIDCAEFPLANYPHYSGIDAEKAFAALEEALASEKVHALTVTEVNPNNDPDGVMVGRVVDAVTQGMKRRLEALFLRQ